MGDQPKRKVALASGLTIIAIKVIERQDFDPAEYLESEAAMAECLTAIIDENNPRCLPLCSVKSPAQAA